MTSAALVYPLQPQQILPVQKDPKLNVVQKFVEGANAVKNDTEYLYNALNTTWYSLMGVEALCGAAEPVTLAMQKVSGTISVIDAAEAISIVDWAINGHMVDDVKKKFVCKVAGTASLGIGIIMGAFLWVAELGFIKLGALAMKIGSTVAGSFCTLGYLFLAGHAIREIITAKNGTQLAKGIIDLISKIGNVALGILILIPGTNVFAIVILGVTAKGLGVASSMVEHFNKKAFAAAPAA